MKTLHIIFLLTVLLVACNLAAASQGPPESTAAPKYDLAAEVTLKGTIVDTIERNCPVAGGLGFHFTFKAEDGRTIEVHVASAKFMKDYEWILNKGDQIKLVGARANVQGADGILAREITRGNETFTFRAKDGKPVW